MLFYDQKTSDLVWWEQIGAYYYVWSYKVQLKIFPWFSIFEEIYNEKNPWEPKIPYLGNWINSQNGKIKVIYFLQL